MKKIFSLIKNIIVSSINLIFKEIILAALPVLLITFICKAMHLSLPVESIFNNLFIAFTTLHAGNMIYLLYESKIYSKDFKFILFIIAFLSMGASLSCAIIIVIDDLKPLGITFDSFYFTVVRVICITIVFIEIFKIIEEVRSVKPNDC